MLSQATNRLLELGTEMSSANQNDALRNGQTDAVVLANIKMVASMCRNYGGKILDADDFFQAGVQGLMLAVERFDVNHSANASFTTYASRWVQKMLNAELNNDLGVSMGSNTQEKERKEIRDGNRERATSVTSGDSMEGGWDKVFGVKEDTSSYITDLREAMSQVDLVERESVILNKHFGLDNSVPLTFEEIGSQMGCSGERVRQILKVSLKKVQKEMCRL